MVRGLLQLFEALGAYVMMVWDVIRVTLRRPPSWHLIADQMYQIGVMSLPVVAFTGFSTGMVLAAQSFFQLSDKGLAGATGLMVGKAMTVELGPVLTAIMITGRVGAAMCAELGTMKVSEQIDALKSMAVSPSRYLVSPRFIGGIVMVPLLTIFSGIMGVMGGYLISTSLYHMAPNDFLDPIPVHVDNFDLFSGLTKALCFGFLIVSISCFLGLRTSGGAAGVGRSTTRSVVISYCMILLMNFFLTLALNTSYNYIERWFGNWL